MEGAWAPHCAAICLHQGSQASPMGDPLLAPAWPGVTPSELSSRGLYGRPPLWAPKSPRGSCQFPALISPHPLTGAALSLRNFCWCSQCLSCRGPPQCPHLCTGHSVLLVPCARTCGPHPSLLCVFTPQDDLAPKFLLIPSIIPSSLGQLLMSAPPQRGQRGRPEPGPPGASGQSLVLLPQPGPDRPWPLKGAAPGHKGPSA